MLGRFLSFGLGWPYPANPAAPAPDAMLPFASQADLPVSQGRRRPLDIRRGRPDQFPSQPGQLCGFGPDPLGHIMRRLRLIRPLGSVIGHRAPPLIS